MSIKQTYDYITTKNNIIIKKLKIKFMINIYMVHKHNSINNYTINLLLSHNDDFTINIENIDEYSNYGSFHGFKKYSSSFNSITLYYENIQFKLFLIDKFTVQKNNVNSIIIMKVEEILSC